MAEQDIIVRVRAEGTEAFIKQLKAAGVSVETVGKEVDKTEKKVSSASASMSSGFKKLTGVIGAAFATQKLIAFGKQLAKLAVELDATNAKYTKVFGDASKTIDKFAKQNATSLGLTESAYKRAAAAAGDLLIPLGFQRQEAANLSKDLVNLSGALAAWSGGQFDATQTAEILTKALLGEREQLKSLGIQISEADLKQRLLEKGQSDLTGSTLAQAKATATLELITEKSADAQAAFADDTKTLAEQQLIARANFETLTETIAQKVIPIYSRLLGVINDIADGNAVDEIIRSLDDATKADFNNAKEALELRRDELIERKKSGDITFREAFELTNRIPKALERINKLEEERNVTVSRRSGGGLDVATAAAEKKAEEEAEKRRRASLGLLERLAEDLEILEEKRKKAFTPDQIQAYNVAIERVKNQIKELTTIQEELNEFTFKFSNILGDISSEFQSIDIGELDNLGLLFDEISSKAAMIGISLVSGLSQAVPQAQEQVEEVGKTAEEVRQENINKALQVTSTINTIQSSAFDAFRAFQQAEIAELDRRFEKGLISEKEYQQERRQLQRKQAKADKAQAIFQATVNTAAAITSALTRGPIIGQILAGIVAAAGAAQIAAIAKTPIPKFRKGTRMVGDGFELGEDRTLAYLNKGERVITADKNKRHFGLYNAIEENDVDGMLKEMAKMGIAVQFNAGEALSGKLEQMKTLSQITQGKASNKIDLNPLLNASDRQRVTLSRKLDQVNVNLVKLGNSLGRRMTQA